MKAIPQMKNIFLFFLLVSFLLGIAFCLSNPDGLFPSVENMETIDETNKKEVDTSCPNVLIRQNGSLLLYNTLEQPSETNPMPFFNLDEYILYVRSQRDKGIRCPVLYLQEESNAQGTDVFRIRNSPFSIEGGLPTKVIPIKMEDASLDNPPYNQGQYQGFDPYSQYAGQYTVLDQIHDSTEQVPVSDNPMDTNWGGVIHSQQQIESGKYDANTVGKPVMVPRVIPLQP
jgi:hypothetical protein